jgi:hypothetical protein
VWLGAAAAARQSWVHRSGPAALAGGVGAAATAGDDKASERASERMTRIRMAA